MQHKTSIYNGTFDAFRKIIATEGFTKLHRGFHIHSFAVLNSQLFASALVSSVDTTVMLLSTSKCGTTSETSPTMCEILLLVQCLLLLHRFDATVFLF